MPKIHLELTVERERQLVFSKMASIDFMRAIDPNFGGSTIVLFQNNRILRSCSTVERIGEVEIERISLPEVFMFITQRRRPLEPFIFQLSILELTVQEGGTLMKWTNEFELNVESPDREKVIFALIEKNDKQNLFKTKSYLLNIA
jgi:hypothetical protein